MSVDWDGLINDIDIASASLEAGRRWGADSEIAESYLGKCKDALRAELAAVTAERDALKTVVTWRQQDYEDGDTWECSGCKSESVWEDDPEDCDVKFCSYCGHPVKFERYEDPLKTDDDLPAPPESEAK